MSDVTDLIMKGLDTLGFIEWVKKRMKISPAWRAKAAAYFLVPGLIAGVYILYGGGLSIDFGKGLAISELKSEVGGGRPVSSKRAVLIIAESVTLDSYVRVANNSARIWSSLDEERAQNNVDSKQLSLDGAMLHIKTPFFQAEQEPVAVIVEGVVAEQIQVLGRTESLQNWRLSSRRSSSIVAAVLINCFMALGVGLATGVAAPINPNEDHAGQVRTEPDEG